MSEQGFIQAAALLLAGGVVAHMLGKLRRQPGPPTTRRDLDSMPRADIRAAQSRDRAALDLLSEHEERVLRRVEVGACMVTELLYISEWATLDAMQLAQLIEVLPDRDGLRRAAITPRGREALAHRAGSPESVHRAETAR
jgi:hypothetical protein